MTGVVGPIDYAVFQNKVYQGLYGGLSVKDIHANKKLRKENIQGKEEAGATHFQVGAKVRQTIKDLGGTMP